jgi:DNA repair exonuclease SbcCD nuclease subunit
MIEKIICLADVHIRTYKRHEEYLEQFEKFYNLAEEEKPDRIVIAGDIVHQKIQMSPELIEVTTNFLNRCSKIAKTIVLIGNHDFLTNNKERLDALSPIISAMNNDNIIYFNRSICYEDENVVWVPISLMDDNKVPECFNPNTKKKDKKYIGLFHSPLNSGETSLGFKFADSYSLDNFKGMDCVIVGDLHRYQIIQKKDPFIFYSGSMLQQDFGESVSQHGFVILNLKDLSHKFVEIPNDYGYYQFNIGEITDVNNFNEEMINE